MKKITNKIMVLLFSVIMLFAANGCVSESGNNGSDDIYTLDVWTVAPLVYNYKTLLKYDSNNKQALFTKAVIEGFETKYKNYKVNLIHSEWGTLLNEALMLAISGNTLPDIVAGEEYIKAYIENNYFQKLNLNEGVEIIDAAAKAGKKDGSWYALPVWTGSLVLNINLNVLEEAGVVTRDSEGSCTVTSAYINSMVDSYGRSSDINPLEPSYWEDMLATSQFIYNYYQSSGEKYKGGTIISNSSSGSAWRALGYMRTAGGEIAENGNVMLYDNADKAANIKAMQMIRSLADTVPSGSTYSTLTEDDLWKLFLQNKAAYIVDGQDVKARAGSGTYNTTSVTYVNDKDILAVELPIYEQDGMKSNVMIGTGYYSITKNCGNYDAAMAFINYLLNSDVQKMLMEYDYRVPAVKGVLNSEEIKQSEIYAAMESFIAPFTKTGYSFNGGIPDFSSATSSVSNIWNTWAILYEGVLNSDTSIDTLLNTAHVNIVEYMAASE